MIEREMVVVEATPFVSPIVTPTPTPSLESRAPAGALTAMSAAYIQVNNRRALLLDDKTDALSGEEATLGDTDIRWIN
jgi:hypothetical protein